MYKKILALVLSVTMIMSFTGCKKSESLPEGTSADGTPTDTQILEDMKKSGVFSDSFFKELPDYHTMKDDMEKAGLISEFSFASESGIEDYYDEENAEWRDKIEITGVYGGIADKAYLEMWKDDPSDFEIADTEGMSGCIDIDAQIAEDISEENSEEFANNEDEDYREYLYPIKANFSNEDCVYYSETKGLSPIVETEKDEDLGCSYVDFDDYTFNTNNGSTLCHLEIRSAYFTLYAFAEKSSMDKIIKLVQKWGLYKKPFTELTDVTCNRECERFKTRDDAEEYIDNAKKWYRDTYNIDLDAPITYDEDGTPRNLTDEEIEAIYNGTDTEEDEPVEEEYEEEIPEEDYEEDADTEETETVSENE